MPTRENLTHAPQLNTSRRRTPFSHETHELYDLDTMPAERAVTGTELVNGFYSVVTFVSSFRFRG